MELTKQMARAHADMWADQKRRADDLEGIVRVWLAAAGPVKEDGFHHIRTSLDFLRSAHRLVPVNHVHVAGQDDACALCGRDLRDDVHTGRAVPAHGSGP